ncbi:MAG: type II secretion system F family protein [Nitrospira sp.]|nr:type II secretion system F family protein [Nitrospira sp.]
MPVFKYSGYNHAGSLIKGVIEADGQRDAVLKIKTKGILPKQIEESVSGQQKILSKKPSQLVLSSITRRLSILVTSSVPLIEAISAISGEHKGEWRNVLTDIKDRLAGGSTLARAMEAYPGIFPESYTGMVAAGESSGKLADVLQKLADFLEKEITIKNKVRTALVYPSFMACLSVLIVFFLFIFVIPKITKVFEDTSTSLPFITMMLIWISTFFKNFWWVLLLTAGGVWAQYRNIMETRRELIDSVLLKEPLGILMELYMLRFTMTIGFLLSGGLQILNAMQLTAKSIGNAVLEKKVLSAQEKVSQGTSLAASLEGFPPTLLQIIATGEKTGKLHEVLLKTAESYEAEFDRKLQRVISLLEPVLILTMGLVVGFIVVAVLLPIFEMNQIMR